MRLVPIKKGIKTGNEKIGAVTYVVNPVTAKLQVMRILPARVTRLVLWSEADRILGFKSVLEKDLFFLSCPAVQ